MKKLITSLLILFTFYSNAQTLCGTADENGVVTLTAPPGNVFISIEFASYGTPTGVCGSFILGACDASNSVSMATSVFVGQNSASLNATNAVFGDPCSGTSKRLYIQATYSASLPLILTSFTAKKIEASKVKLEWSSESEINTSHFVIERSTPGVLFESAGSVVASGGARNNYSFSNSISGTEPTFFYRLKMIDRDGRFQYSNIVRINNTPGDASLSVFPNPADKLITINSSILQQAFITNSAGILVKKILLVNGSQTINVEAWKAGIYFIRTETGVLKFIKR